MDQRPSGSAGQRISGPNQEIHGSARPRILQSAIFLYLSTAFHTRAFLLLIAGSFSKKLYLKQVSDSACHQQHHDLRHVCPSGSHPPHCLTFWDLLFEEPYPTLSVVIQSWMCGLRSSSLPLRCPVWQFHQGGQPSRRATILTATQIHVHACHQQHHDYIMNVLLAAILHIV